MKSHLAIAASLCVALGAVAPRAIAADAEPLTNITFVAFDLETTGFSRERDRIVEIGAVKFRNGETLATRTWLVNPGMPIPEIVQAVHGINDGMVADAPPFKEVYAEFREFVGTAVLLAHNARFDLQFLGHEALRNEREPPDNPVLDTLRMARACYPEAGSHTLSALMAELNLPAGAFHRGLSDALYVRDIFFVMTADDRRPLHDWIELAGSEFTAD